MRQRGERRGAQGHGQLLARVLVLAAVGALGAASCGGPIGTSPSPATPESPRPTTGTLGSETPSAHPSYRLGGLGTRAICPITWVDSQGAYAWLSASRPTHLVRVRRCLDLLTVEPAGSQGHISLTIDGQPVISLDIAEVKRIGEEAGSGEHSVVLLPPMELFIGQVMGLDLAGCTGPCPELDVEFAVPPEEKPPAP